MIVIALFLLVGNGLFAQKTPTEELRKQADELFEQERFGETLASYSQLLSLNPTNPDLNYRFGACLVYGSADKDKAFKHLRFAMDKEGIPPEIHFFLGKAYHLTYQFTEALEQYRIYEQKTDRRRKGKIDVTLAIAQCQNGQNLLSNIKDITVLNKVETSEKDFFRNYDLEAIGGRILVCPEELLTTYDLKTGERFLMYFPGNTSTVFFSSYGKKGDTGRDIYRASRLPNGNWSKPIPMTGINTPYNDDFPFLHPDGETFYFASEGHSSMGGYDIFKCTYNPATDKFTQPENLDFAVNTPDDDMLYITDRNHEMAWFSSSRSSDQGRMHVYKVMVAANPLQLVFIKGTFKPDVPGVTPSARITVTDALTQREVGQFATDATTGQYMIDLPRSGKYRFTVDAQGSELAHNGLVEVPAHPTAVAFGQELELLLVNNNEQLVIKNLFDSPLQEDMFALARDVLKYRAGLEVNYDPTAVAEKPVLKTPETGIENLYQAAGFAEGLSNQAVVEISRDAQRQLEAKTENIRNQRDVAYTLAEAKREAAAKAARDAGDLLRLADAVGDQEVSSRYYMQAAAARHAANKLANESEVALALAGQLNERMVEVEQEEQRAMLRAEALENALQSGEREAVIAAMKEVKTARDEEQKQGTDEYLALRERAQKERKSADISGRMAQELRDDEASLMMRIKNRRLQMESAKVKDRPAIQREIDILEQDLNDVQGQIENLFGSLKDGQQGAESLAQQAELYRKIEQKATDLYIPADKVRSFEPGQVAEVTRRIQSVRQQTSDMDLSMEVVRTILEDDANIALKAFESTKEFEDFVSSYDLGAQVRAEPVRAMKEEEAREQIAAAEDWIEVIGQNIAELEQERATLEAGVQRDEIDRQIEEFQQLKGKQLQEIDDARKSLAEIGREEAVPFSITAAEPAASSQSADPRDRPSLTVAQAHPVYAELDPDFHQKRENIAATSSDVSEEMARMADVNRGFLVKVEREINSMRAIPEEEMSPQQAQRLDALKEIRSELTDEMVAYERERASAIGQPAPTSAQIMMEIAGLAERTETEASETRPSETSGIAASEPAALSNETTEESPAAEPVSVPEDPIAAIPESIGYEDIDPAYETAVQRIQTTSLAESERTEAVIELGEQFISKIDEKVAEMEALRSTTDESGRRKIDRAISQMEQVRAIKANELEAERENLQTLRHEEFVAEHQIIINEADADYANEYQAITTSTDSEYIKTVRKAQLEQRVANRIEARIEELVGEMDAANDGAERQQKQELIQELQLQKQERTIAYESLFASAEQLRQSDEEWASTPSAMVKEESPADVAVVNPEQADAALPEERTTETEMPITEEAIRRESTDQLPGEEFVADESETVEEVSDASEINAGNVQQWLGSSETYLASLQELIVFGDVEDLSYKSLGASLALESMSGDLQRHHNRVIQLVESRGTQIENEESLKALTNLLRDEEAMQLRAASVNQQEWSYFSESNSNLMEQLEARNWSGITQDDVSRLQQEQNDAATLLARAAELRNEARSESNFSARMQRMKEAFYIEAQAIEKLARVNAVLDELDSGSQMAWEESASRVVPIAVTGETMRQSIQSVTLAELAITAEADESEVSEETGSVQIAAQEPILAFEPEVRSVVQQDFGLTPEQIERVEASPVAMEWFSLQAQARQAEQNKKRIAVEASSALDDAERKLVESEEWAARADEADNESEREEASRKATGLQDEARALFLQAQQLRDELARLNKEVEDSRSKADEVLAKMEPSQSRELVSLVQEEADMIAAAQEPRVDQTDVQEPSAQVIQDAEPESRAEEVPQPRATQTSVEADEEPSETIADTSPATTTSAPETPQQVRPMEIPEPRLESPVTRTAYAPIPELQMGVSTQRFETTAQPQYSTANPIPVDNPWPEGLVFAVQVGAFRNPIPQDHFSGFSPIRADRVAEGITRYTAGLFPDFNRAMSARDYIRNRGYNDAFVVAYLNGERIALNRIPDESQAADAIAQATGKQRVAGTTSPAPAVSSSAPAETTQASEAPGTISTTTPESGRTAQPVEAPRTAPATDLRTDYYSDPDAATATQVERIRGLFFTVQVGVYSKPVSSDALNNIMPLNSELTNNGYIRYTSGMFPSVELAQSQRQVVMNAGVSDAFITAYYDGRRITMAEARALLAAEGEDVLAGTPRAAETPQTEPVEPTSVEPEPAPGESATPPAQVDGFQLESAYDFQPRDIRFLLDLGSYGNEMPQEVADAILALPDAGVSRLQLPNGKLHYLSRPTKSYAEVEALKDTFMERGVTESTIRAMALGFLLKVDEAREVTGQ
ncbi:MAG: hypothetical protein EA392_02770 [Cryomorphaceae bacterium]|nr:MAG: hypothetical protein EA392_02770 [Cryomorphaceae bacterium]